LVRWTRSGGTSKQRNARETVATMTPLHCIATDSRHIRYSVRDNAFGPRHIARELAATDNLVTEPLTEFPTLERCFTVLACDHTIDYPWETPRFSRTMHLWKLEAWCGKPSLTRTQASLNTRATSAWLHLQDGACG
jgi:hypothetical protein